MKSFVQSFSVLMKLTKEEHASLFERDKTLFITPAKKDRKGEGGGRNRRLEMDAAAICA